MRSLRNAVVVIAGASSGIGRAAALAFARRGARVVLAARRALPLEEAARQCRDAGAAEATAVPTDVTDEAAVAALARAALEDHGRIDVWVNNVGTGVFGPFQDAPVALHRRVIETNLIGALHGTAAALPAFLHQGRGVLINMASMGAWSPTPYAASYAASKFGIRGLSASLRGELAGRPGIRVCAIFPSLVDTPGLAHGANVSGRAIEPSGPFLAPEAVAEVILRLAQRPRDEVAVGWPATATRIAYALSPALTERAAGAAMRGFLRRARPAPRTEGAVVAPVPGGTGTGGGWRRRSSGGGAVPGGALGLALAGVGLVVGTEALIRLGRGARWG